MIVIPINSKTYGLKHFFIDGEDFEKVKNFKWFVHYSKQCDSFYVESKIKINNEWRQLRLHRYLLNAPDDKFVDHKDLNPLNNCKENLRLCSQSQNRMNGSKQKNGKTSKYKGVNYLYRKKTFVARINYNKKRITLGTFKNESDAALAYNEAAKKYYKEFARLNEV